MIHAARNWQAWTAALALTVTLAGCGGGSGGTASTDGTTTTSQTGSVALLLTDAPADLALFTEINATIERVELIRDDDHKTTIFSGPPVTKNLLDLRTDAIPLSFDSDVPIGKYCKIRLILSDLELVFTDPTQDPVHPKRPGNGKLDLVARDCFHVFPDTTATIMADMDMEKSIHIVQAGKGKTKYNFRPVIFVTVLTGDLSERLVRIDGVIERSDPVTRTVLLCDALPMHDDDDGVDDGDSYRAADHDDGYVVPKGCVTVNIGDGTSFFDNLTFDGDARPLAEIFDADKLGADATVVGKVVIEKYRDDDDGYHDDDDGYRDDDYDDDYDDKSHRSYLSIDALVLEAGPFLEELSGSLVGDAEESGFTMEVDPGQVVGSGDPLAVDLQPAPAGGNGTKILEKDGTVLSYLALTDGQAVLVDGVLQIGSAEDRLKAALVFVDGDLEPVERIVGEIVELLAGGDFRIAPDGEACGVMTSSFQIDTDSETRLFTVVVTDSDATSSFGADLAPGDRVEVYGSCDAFAGDLDADTVLLIDDQRSDSPTS